MATTKAVSFKFETLTKMYERESANGTDLSPSSDPRAVLHEPVSAFNDRISIFRGDITTLGVDAIVNAANEGLLGGGGVDGAIHRAAGPGLLQECSTLQGCAPGSAKITRGYRLPARHVIHAVGPVAHRGERPDELAGCYRTALQLARRNGARSVAFPCISTGVYGYPQRAAAHVVLATVRQWLADPANCASIDLIVFCVFLQEDQSIYSELVRSYFPPAASST